MPPAQAHNNTIRCLLHNLCNESEEQTAGFEVATGGAVVLKISADALVTGRQDLESAAVPARDDDDGLFTDETANSLAWPAPDGSRSCTESFTVFAAFLACSAVPVEDDGPPPSYQAVEDVADEDEALASAHAMYRASKATRAARGA